MCTTKVHILPLPSFRPYRFSTPTPKQKTPLLYKHKIYSTNHNHETTPMCVVCKTIHTHIVSVTHRLKHPTPCHAMPSQARQRQRQRQTYKQPKPLRASLQARSGTSAYTKSTSGSSISATRSTVQTKIGH